jgi:hypothetical protein
MRGVDNTDHEVRYCPWYRKTGKWTKEFMLLLLQLSALNNSTLLKKYTTNQIRKGKDYAFTLHCGHIMPDPAQSEDGNDRWDDDALAADWNSAKNTVTQMTASDGSSWPSTGWTRNSCSPSEDKKDAASRKCRVRSAHTQRKEASTNVRVAVWHFAKLRCLAKLRFSANTTRKIKK